MLDNQTPGFNDWPLDNSPARRPKARNREYSARSIVPGRDSRKLSRASGRISFQFRLRLAKCSDSRRTEIEGCGSRPARVLSDGSAVARWAAQVGSRFG